MLTAHSRPLPPVTAPYRPLPLITAHCRPLPPYYFPHAPRLPHLLRHRRRADRQGLRPHHRPRPHARMAPQLPLRHARPQAHGQRRPPPYHLRARRPARRCRNRDHRLLPAPQLRLGRDPPPQRLPHLHPPPVPRRRHQDHHEIRVGAGGPARLAARPVLPAPRCTSDVRQSAAESEKGAYAIARKGRREMGEAPSDAKRTCGSHRAVPLPSPFSHQSTYGTSIVMPSLATVVSGNTRRASLTSSSALIE